MPLPSGLSSRQGSVRSKQSVSSSTSSLDAASDPLPPVRGATPSGAQQLDMQAADTYESAETYETLQPTTPTGRRSNGEGVSGSVCLCMCVCVCLFVSLSV